MIMFLLLILSDEWKYQYVKIKHSDSKSLTDLNIEYTNISVIKEEMIQG